MFRNVKGAFFAFLHGFSEFYDSKIQILENCAPKPDFCHLSRQKASQNLPTLSMNSFFRLLAFFFTICASLPIGAAPAALCVDGECQPAITQTRYFDRDAYRLSDGKTEAVIVPALGRIMSFKKVGGENVLWNSPTSAGINQGWLNFGGDKNWMAPQSAWKVMHGRNGWPPDAAFDGKPHEAEVLTGAKVRMVSPLSATGIRLTRTIYFADNGELVVEQTASKESGKPVRAGIWSIAQAVPGEAIYLPTNPRSPYKNNYFWFGKVGIAQKIEALSPSLLKIEPQSKGSGVKIGVDSPVSAIASVRNGTTFLLKTAKPKGNYPDGADEAGFPVELYVNGDKNVFYVELELLAPLQNFFVGTKFTHTMRWSLHNTTAPTEIEALLQAPPSVSQ